MINEHVFASSMLDIIIEHVKTKGTSTPFEVAISIPQEHVFMEQVLNLVRDSQPVAEVFPNYVRRKERQVAKLKEQMRATRVEKQQVAQ